MEINQSTCSCLNPGTRIECELPEDHDGNHKGVDGLGGDVTWPQAEFDDPWAMVDR